MDDPALGTWAWPITAEVNGRANFGPAGPAGAAKKNASQHGRARPIVQKERPGLARPARARKKNAAIKSFKTLV